MTTLRAFPDRRTRPRGRAPRRIYLAHPHLGLRDGTFYGFLWLAGLAAWAAGSPREQAAAALGWGAWLTLAWLASRWLRGQEEFGGGAAEAFGADSTGLVLGLLLPGIAFLTALAFGGEEGGRGTLRAAALTGMAAAAPVAFLERAFALGAGWAFVGLLAGLGGSAPAGATGFLAAGAGAAFLAVTAAQRRSFLHFPGEPWRGMRLLVNDLGLPLLVFLAAGLASWAWTPELRRETERPVRQVTRVPVLPGLREDPAPGPVEQIRNAPRGLPSGDLPLPPLRWILGAGGGVALAAWLCWRRRRGKAPAEEKAMVEEPRRHATVMLVPKREGGTPDEARAAVIFHYARLRRSLPPQEALTPAEYARAAPSGPLSEITALFEEAGYSRHPMPPEAGKRAADCCARILAEA